MIEVKNWSYEEYPDFLDREEAKGIEAEGVHVLQTTGKEPGTMYMHDVEYAKIGDVTLHLQIVVPNTREERVAQEPLMRAAFAEGKRPENPAKRPCMVYVQGSAWMKQNVYGSVVDVARMCARGYVVAIVEYRHSGIASFPAPAEDARNAIRFMRVHAKEFGVDPEKIVLAGNSSGGHTAMEAGILHDDEGPANLFPGVSAEVPAIVNFYGSVSAVRMDGFPTTVNHHMPDSPEGMEMGHVNLLEHPELIEQLSIECNIHPETEIAPVLIFHGTKDKTVNPVQSLDLYRKLKECGKDVELYYLAGSDHGGPEFWTDEVVDIIDAFYRKHLNL